MKLVLTSLRLLLVLWSSTASAQTESRTLIVPSAVLSFQTVDKTYQGPYLNDHLGGLGWGGSLGILGQHRRFVFGGEISSVRLSKEMSGRLVGSVDPQGAPIPARVRFQDTFLSGVIGGSSASRKFQVLGGVGLTYGWPEIEGDPSTPLEKHSFVVTGGSDWFVPISDNARLAFGFRYAHVFRHKQLVFLGVGKEVVRATLGVAFGPR